MRFGILMCAAVTLLSACATTPKPAPIVVVDSDGDGIVDGLDRCPGTEHGFSVDIHGCPSDSDGDGVFDFIDRCPDTPATAAVDRYGCELDDDGDGIANDRDQCPGTAEGVVVDAVGCPVPPPPAPPEPVVMELQISFKTGEARLERDYTDEFARGAAFVRQHSHCRVVIEGHSDSVGPADYNQKLSQRRAELVRDLLVGQLGGQEIEMAVAGFGESRPVAANDTQAGREQNRRVLIVISCDTADK